MAGRPAILALALVACGALSAASRLSQGSGSSAAAGFPVRDGMEVLLAQVLTRHGARTPNRVHLGAPEPGSDAWEEQFGQCRPPGAARALLSNARQGGGGDPMLRDLPGGGLVEAGGYRRCPRGYLTRVGEAEMEAIGRYLRKTYVDVDAGGPLITPERPVRRETLVFSTAVARTVLSAQCLLRGLYPAADQDELDIFVQVPRSLDEEIITVNHWRCPRLRQIALDQRSSYEVGLLSTSTRNRLRDIIGPSVDDLTMVMAGDSLRAYAGHGIPPPPGYSEELLRDIDTCGHGSVEAAVGGSQEVVRLSSGLLLADMHRRITAAIEGHAPLRLMVRSGHDISIAQILLALGLPSHSWPAFASSITVELLRDVATQRHWVRVVFHDGVPEVVAASVDITVPFEKWTEFVGPLLMVEEEYIEQCKLAPGTPIPPRMFW